MEKLKIAVTTIGTDAVNESRIRSICEDPVVLDLCTTIVYEKEEALCELSKGNVNALVLYPSTESVKRPVESIEFIVTDKTIFIPIRKEPSIEEIVQFRDILERDFDIHSPRVAIVLEGNMQNPDFANQVTTEQGINTYGPYTLEQILAEDAINHFDCIVIIGDSVLEQHIIAGLSQDAPVRFFANTGTVITSTYHPVLMKEEEEGVTDISELTHPIYIAIDVIRNRILYDKARQNPLPKLFRDKRDDRKKDDVSQNKLNSQNEE